MNLVELVEVKDLGLPPGALELDRTIKIFNDTPDEHRSARLTLGLHCTVRPNAGPYAGAIIPLRLLFPPAYPWEGPRILCARRLWHPSVDPLSGALCLNILRLGWKPVLGLSALLLGLWLVLQIEDTVSNFSIPSPSSAGHAKGARLHLDQGGHHQWSAPVDADTEDTFHEDDPYARAATAEGDPGEHQEDDDALNGEAAQLLRRDPKQFATIVALTLRGGTYGGITYDNCMGG